MIKLLLVDDESVTRNGLMKHIPWGELGVDIVRDAKDGIEALETAERFQPDIIVSDIKMPGMEGIKFCEMIRERYPDCKIIFISGYSNKRYLKAAIEISALSYVEKPINIDEMKEAVRKAVALCLESEKKRADDLNINRVVHENLPFLKQKIILELIRRKHDTEKILKDLEFINAGFDTDGLFGVMVVKIDIAGGTANEDDSSVQNAVLEIVDGYLPPMGHISALKDKGHAVVILSPGKPDIKDELGGFFKDVLCSVNSRFMGEVRLFCAVGENVGGIDRIYESYNTAVVAMQKLFYSGYDRMVFSDVHTVKAPPVIDESIVDPFSRLLTEYKEDDAVALVENFCRDLKRHGFEQVNNIKNILFKLALVLFNEAESMRVDLNEANPGSKYLWDIISSFQTLDEIEEYLVSGIRSTFRKTGDLSMQGRTVNEVVRYIRENYHRDLTIKILADHVFLTPTYLSYLFKRMTGKTVSEYITQTRIEKSKEYLINKRLKLFEVAKCVGYSDPNYYAKTFKKMIGLNPSEYRDRYADTV